MSRKSVGTEQMRLSRLGLGTVQFGFKYGVNNARGQVPYDEVCNILTSASDQGVNFLDTSRLYGAREGSARTI